MSRTEFSDSIIEVLKKEYNDLNNSLDTEIQLELDGKYRPVKKINNDIYSFDYYINNQENNSIILISVLDLETKNKYSLISSYITKELI